MERSRQRSRPISISLGQRISLPTVPISSGRPSMHGSASSHELPRPWSGVIKGVGYPSETFSLPSPLRSCAPPSPGG